MNTRLPLQVCVWVYCLSWAFDYRAAGGGGGSAVQYLSLAFTLASATGTIILGLRQLLSLPMGWIALGWSFYLLSTPVVAAVNHVSLGWYFKNTIPPLLLFTSLCVTQIAASCGLHWKHVLWPTLIAGTVNVLWKIFYALVIAGIPVHEVRVELLSPCLPFLLGFLFSSLALQRQVPWLAIFVGALATLSYALSVTRSAVFIVGAAGGAAILTWWLTLRLRVLPRGFGRIKLVHASVAAGTALVAGATLALAFPFVIERWAERLFYTAGKEQSSADPSALTRYAETKSFIDLLNREPLTWLYGKGLGATYYWDESYAVELAEYTYGNEDQFRSDSAAVNFPGHSIWTYAIFSGGVIGGICYAALFTTAALVSYQSIRCLRQVPSYPVEIACMPFICLMAYLSQSLTINPFIERSGGLMLGLVIGFPQFLFAAAWQAQRDVKLHGKLPFGAVE